MADRIPDSLIDDILASTKKYTDTDSPKDSDSNIDIDALIMSLKPDKGKSEKKPQTAKDEEVLKTFEPKTEEKAIVVEEKKQAPAAAETPKVKEQAVKEPKKEETSPAKHKIDLSKYGRIEEDKPQQDEAQKIAEEILKGDKESEETVDIEEKTIAIEPIIEEQEEEKIDPLKEEKQIQLEKTRMFNEVKVHGEFNPNIEHNLGNKVTRTTTSEAEPLSSPVMGEEKYRKHFMNKPEQNLEKTQEHRAIIDAAPEKTMETPGVIVRRNDEPRSSDDGVEPLPQIIPAEEELRRFERTKDADGVKVKTEAEDDNQIMLDGFGEEEEVKQLSEEEAEAQLRLARQKAVEEFVSKGLIFKQDDDEEEIQPEQEEEPKGKKRFKRQKIHVSREYFGPKDAVAVEDEYYSENKKIKFRLISSILIGLLMCALATSVGFNNGNFALYNNNENIYLALQGICLLVCCLINFSSFKDFFVNIGRGQANVNTAVVVAALAGFLQCGISFAFTDSVESVAHLVTAAAVIPMVIKAISDLIQNKNDLDNFYIVSDIDEDIYSVENIDDEETANEITRGLMLGDPEIKYSKGVTIPTKFVELSRTADATASFYKYAVPAIAVAALIIGVAAGFVMQSIYAAFSTFSMVILMGLPASAAIAASASLRHANKILNEEGTLVNGFAAVEDAINSNGIIIDCGDAFQRGGCNIEGIKLYHKMRIDEAILYTASVVIESGGVLSTVFEGVIDGKHQLLLPVESLAYEEKLGCSCWIHNHRVLVGNRELLKHHNVDTPDDELENKYKNEGKNVIYLAIEGKISAMFVVVYKSEPETAKYIRWVEKDGIALFFRTSDANITEEFIEREFRLAPHTVKIINPVAGEMFQKVKHGFKDRTEAKILHDGRVVTMLKAINAACGINSIINASKTVQTIAAVAGVILVALMAFLSGLEQISAWQIIVYHLFWSLISYILPKIKKI